MCLAVPGEVLTIEGEKDLNLHGQVSFGGNIRKISFAFTPEVQVGDFIIAHVGVALSIVEPDKAREIFELLELPES